ncbi:hypothetical protein DFH07DRAFT_907765 [Mycena maculata]|uniref:Uncharacterized protein n=1 Tax=Mycena maculata TaxID=230809 RepID=A0AAD7KGJ5_9AGAR|nr:hypothetical protein DFH07DRAFT_907765 [Mycena maculata]
MCWGKAKQLYRLNPPSSKEEDVEKNMLTALDSVTLVDMRKFARRARRFMDAYKKGLDGKWAAWASRKYPGHRTYPEELMIELDAAKEAEKAAAAAEQNQG